MSASATAWSGGMIAMVVLAAAVALTFGVLAAGLRTRRAFRRMPGAFPCKTRTVSPMGRTGSWSRSTAYACWIHDVLFLHPGFGRVRALALPVDHIDGPIAATPDVTVKNRASVSLRLTLDDGSREQVAVPAWASELLVGPFVALHLVARRSTV
jgi:hypothetical protein